MAARNILIFGASYGALLGIKLALAGHSVKLVCRASTAELINAEGIVVRMPVKDRKELVEVRSRGLPGQVTGTSPEAADPRDYDLIVLAMQEPQYRAPGVRELFEAAAASGVPCMSIMNMAPLPYLKRIPGVDPALCGDSYTDASLWDGFDPRLMTLCSPDPQAFRPAEEPANVLQVRLPTNFKAARFESDAHTTMLRELAGDIENARHEIDGQRVDLPVKLKVHDSVFVPLAKWAMLLAATIAASRTTACDPSRTPSTRPRCLAVGLRLGRGPVRFPRRGPRRHGALRQVRQRRAVAAKPLLRGARARRRRAQYRARGSPGAGDGRPGRHEQPVPSTRPSPAWTTGSCAIASRAEAAQPFASPFGPSRGPLPRLPIQP